MRSARWLFCAAVGASSNGGDRKSEDVSVKASQAPGQPHSPPTSASAQQSGQAKGTTGNTATPAFRPLRLHPWQVLSIQNEPFTTSTGLPAAAEVSPSLSSSSSSSSTSRLTGKLAMAEKLSRLPSTALLYHGSKLGPRPLVILDQSLPPPPTPSGCDAESPVLLAGARDGDAKANAAAALRAMGPSEAAVLAAKKFEAVLSHVSWDHGAVYIPLHVAVPTPGAGVLSEEEEVSLLDLSCRQVAAVLDALDIRWSHFLTYSYGTLVAARMAASRSFPHRIGSLLSLDTPLITRAMVHNATAREELQAARADVNVPLEELHFAQQQLKENLEEPLPCPAVELAKATNVAANMALAKNEQALYHDYLFEKDAIFAEEGLVRKENRYTPLYALSEMQHCFQLIVPAKDPLCDLLTHKEFFGLRRPAVVKTAFSHANLFGFVDKGTSEHTHTTAGASADGKKATKADVDGDNNRKSSNKNQQGQGNNTNSSGGSDSFAPEAAAKEVGDIVTAWLNRFEPDVVLKRRYEQAAKDMTQLMGGGGATAAAAAEGAGGSSGDGKKKGKKEKKKKG